MEIFTALIILGGGAAAVALAPFTLAVLGFTAAGIAASSIAAKLMSYFAIANGGGIPAGGLIATLMSWAMGGLTWMGNIVFGVIGATAGAAIAGILSAIWNLA